MIKIRTKLLVFFIVLVVTVNSVAFFLYSSSEKMISEYDSSFQRFLLLNEISQRTNAIVEHVNAYIIEKDTGYLEKYENEKSLLTANKRRLSDEIGNRNNYITLLNYENMLESFIKESDMAVSFFKKSDINSYSRHFNEAMEIATYIQESTLALADKELTSYQPYFERLKTRNLYYKMTALFLFSGTLIVSTLLALKLSTEITRPIRELSAAAREISGGNFSGKNVEVFSKDELSLLTETFNQMRSNIVSLVSEIKEKSELDKLLKELELKSLQNQINPHFLFNTLNNVSRLAYLEDAHETTRLVEAISALLRYNLAHIDKPSTLREEAAVVREYFHIQRTRFGDRISFQTDIDDACLDVPIPRMTLQPIVENAFIHGVESNEEGSRIRLAIYRRGEDIVVEIEDNGEGMDSRMKENLLAGMEDAVRTGQPAPVTGHSTGIGVKNVIRRLQIFYQNKRVAEIDSERGRGTAFRILLPLGQGGEKTG